MRMKHIAARDMKEAMQKARAELGEHAVLLRSESQQGGKGVLVTFATDDVDELILDEPNAVTSSSSAVVVPIKPTSFSSTGYDVAREVLRFHHAPEPLLTRLEEGMRQARIHALTPLEAAHVLVQDAIKHALSFAALPLKKGHAYMAVGAHGVGKTTLIAKLATQAHLEKTPVTLISTDTERLGGMAALEQLGQVLGIEVLVAQTRSQLRDLLKVHKPNHLVLVDSPGVNIYHFQEMKALGEFASLDDVQSLLLLPCNHDAREAEELVGVFSFLEIQHIVLTKTDATRRYAGALAALNHCNAAIALMVTSAKPTEAAQIATAEKIAELLLTYQRERQG